MCNACTYCRCMHVFTYVNTCTCVMCMYVDTGTYKNALNHANSYKSERTTLSACTCTCISMMSTQSTCTCLSVIAAQSACTCLCMIVYAGTQKERTRAHASQVTITCVTPALLAATWYSQARSLLVVLYSSPMAPAAERTRLAFCGACVASTGRRLPSVCRSSVLECIYYLVNIWWVSMCVCNKDKNCLGVYIFVCMYVCMYVCMSVYALHRWEKPHKGFDRTFCFDHTTKKRQEKCLHKHTWMRIASLSCSRHLRRRARPTLDQAEIMFTWASVYSIGEFSKRALVREYVGRKKRAWKNAWWALERRIAHKTQHERVTWALYVASVTCNFLDSFWTSTCDTFTRGSMQARMRTPSRA